ATSYGIEAAREIRIGSSALIEAVVTSRPNFGEFVKVDVYAGLIRPNGSRVWISGTALAPTLVESATPVPFLAGVTGKSTAIAAPYRFAAADPRGWYTSLGAVVSAGVALGAPCGWIDPAAAPLLVSDPLVPPQP